MNKGEIRAHFIALLNRSDCSNALADTFIDQALTRIKRILRIPSMERQDRYDVTSADGVSSLFIPADFLELIDIYYDGVALVRIPLHEMIANQKTGEVGSPRFFCREQGQFKLHPQPTSGIVYLNYYAEPIELVNDTDSNTLTVIGSDLVTYTALSYASDYFLDERAEVFEGRSGQFLSEIQEQANSAEQSGTSQVMRPTHRYED